MAFPTDPLDVKIELDLGGWTDVTEYVYTRDPITITRGRADEASGVDPSACSLTFNNRDGRFSPRNPTGPYFGVIGRNTPIRLSALLGGARLVNPDDQLAVTAPDSAGLSITGDIDLRAEIDASDWANGRFIRKGLEGSGTLSYAFRVTGGSLVFFWSVDGSTLLFGTSTVPLPRTTGRQAVRATLDVDNGAAGRTITFYTSDSIDGTWAQLGEPVVQAGTTNIIDTAGVVEGPHLFSSCNVYALRILQGIGGTVRANPDFTAQAEGATSFVDGVGNTWTLTGSATLTARRYRLHGEVSSWPNRWDLSGKDVWVPVQAAGIQRRLGQGASPLASANERIMVNNASAVAYWPMTDSVGSTSIASGLPNGAPMTITGIPTLATSTTFLSSRPLPEMSGASFSGAVASYAATGEIHLRSLLAVPASGAPDESVILRLQTTGTAARWDFVYDFTGGLNLYAFNSFGTQILSLGVGYQVNGVPSLVVLELTQDGSDIDYAYGAYYDGTPFGLQTGTLAGRTVGAAMSVQVNANRQFEDVAIGHVVVLSEIPTWHALDATLGYPDEAAGRRVKRLCEEEGIAFVGYGNLDDSAAMGPQRPATLPELLDECQSADLGMLIEPRETFGLGYRVRSSLYNQLAALPLDYGDTRDLTPTDDDYSTRNDITVTRLGGSSARQELASGALSTQAPPNGVGRYDESIEINVATDDALPGQASWRLHMGTVDEARYPVIGLMLESTPFASSSTLTSQALDLDVGDLVTIANPPAWLPPDQIRQIAQGFTEVLEPFAWSLQINCTPASPWDVGLYDQDDPPSRYDTAGCELAEALDTTETGVDVTTTVLPVWTQDSADYPFDLMVGGERMTATACSGAGAAQTFTVTRSVNGVVKTHAIGADVRLADPDYYAL